MVTQSQSGASRPPEEAESSGVEKAVYPYTAPCCPVCPGPTWIDSPQDRRQSILSAAVVVEYIGLRQETCPHSGWAGDSL